MACRTTIFKNTVGAAFVSNDVVSEPSSSAFESLSVGTAMKARRRMGVSFQNAMKRLLTYTKYKVNNAPTLDNALVDQSVAEGGELSYAFASDSFSDADSQTLTYSAILADGSALPEWVTFTAGTRTFAGTAPAVDADTDIDITVFATDIYGVRTSGDFTITVTAA